MYTSLRLQCRDVLHSDTDRWLLICMWYFACTWTAHGFWDHPVQRFHKKWSESILLCGLYHMTLLPETTNNRVKYAANIALGPKNIVWSRYITLISSKVFTKETSYLTHKCEFKLWSLVYLRDHSGHGLSQWETTLHCNVVSHWLSQYPE